MSACTGRAPAVAKAVAPAPSGSRVSARTCQPSASRCAVTARPCCPVEPTTTIVFPATCTGSPVMDAEITTQNQTGWSSIYVRYDMGAYPGSQA
ncbi:hypothetical protein GCM10009609_51710 [Pseudonocardia aurantiaca]